ncbi:MULTISPECIES: YitT family protein [Brevibacterium]|uniref:Membrane protein n=1 Tax=Brevibacterium pityocampae TaxID=506594 RepID=A0ABP8J025_9MICO|nr:MULTISPECIES: hypothetical protein [Actinomycetes]MCK1803500.1 hypothetical protein [Brevibacterium sp. R8603A2]MCX0278231.1 hypothetical protein [Nocardia zapadnayensis]QCP04475.1 hypothetical protein FDF13_03505 [Brevibacterium sp. CS2]
MSSGFRLLAQHPLPVRLLALFGGLALYGFSGGLMIAAGLGNMPWDVLHQGISLHVPLTIGVVGIIVSILVLLTWIPLRQRPGLGTISNALLVGVFIDLTLLVVDRPQVLWAQILLMCAGIVLNGLATVLYIIPNFGPGPRDGLMTGLVQRTGASVTVVRSCIEVVVIAVGWLLGGVFFVGSVLYAFGIGPVTQLFLRLAARLLGPADPMASEHT